MNDIRKKWLTSLTDEEKMKLTYRDFIASEVEEILDELLAPKHVKEEARLFYFECLTIQGVAEKEQIDIKTAKSHRKKLTYAMRKTLCKMFPYEAS